MTSLRIDQANLIGANRRLELTPGLNVISGDIASGKTTLLRLLRALLGSKPSSLPPETERIERLQGNITIAGDHYSVSRPFVSTPTAPVDITGEDEALRLPASRPTPGSSATYGSWLLERLDIPAVEVPSSRTQRSNGTTPVTINDWLNYCFIPGDEIDVMVFGHGDPFRDVKRRYVFELNYGLYDAQAAQAETELRQIERKVLALEAQVEAARNFLAHTAFASANEVTGLLESAQRTLQEMSTTRPSWSQSSSIGDHAAALRDRVSELQVQAYHYSDILRSTEGQVKDLKILLTDLRSQAGRLNRVIVSAESLSDIDFILCPRCGQGLDGSERDDPGACRLCLQHLPETQSHEVLLKELDRVYAQLAETDELLSRREAELLSVREAQSASRLQLEQAQQELEAATNRYVSEHADAIAADAAERARLGSDIERYRDYMELYAKHELVAEQLTILDERRTELNELLDSANTDSGFENVRELERRFTEYLQRLHAPLVDAATVPRINRKTYLPELGRRNFDSLSSQGLATLVNVAHALAHHTVSLQRGLPLPGLLVLDGLSSNLGHEDFDAARVDDMYRLLREVADEYADSLQIVVFDNDPPESVRGYERLRLTQQSRLIQ